MNVSSARSTPWRILLAGAVALLLLSRASVRAAEPEPKSNDYNVILISIDALRADHLGSYGYHRDTSPNLDRIAKEGVLFEEATAAASWTVPSHMSMLTGLYPSTHGVNGIGRALGDAVPTLAGVLAEHGYTTAGITTGVLHPQYGFDRGFHSYDNSTLPVDGKTSGDTISDLATNWLRRNGQAKKFFLFLHYWDCHDDFDPPPPHDRKFDPDYQGKENGRGVRRRRRELAKGMSARDLEHLVALYDGEIYLTDGFVGKVLKLLDDLGLTEKTLVVVTGDHGEAFLEHDLLIHGNSLYEEALHVPLTMRLPKALPTGLRVPGNVSHVDMMPTILGLLQIPVPPTVQGADLSAVSRGEGNVPPTRLIFSELKESSYDMRAVRWGPYKMIKEKGKPPTPLLVVDGWTERDARKVGLDEEQCQAIETHLAKALKEGPAAPTETGMQSKAAEQSQEFLDLLRTLGYL